MGGQTKTLLELSRGNTLVLVLSLRRLSNNLITIEGFATDYSRIATTKKVAEELRTLPANGYEIIGEFMFKNTFLKIENIFAANSETIYSVLKIFAVCSQDGVDIYTISMLLKLDYVSLQPIISLLCRYLIIEADGDGYTLNRFAEKYIIQRFMYMHDWPFPVGYILSDTGQGRRICVRREQSIVLYTGSPYVRTHSKRYWIHGEDHAQTLPHHRLDRPIRQDPRY